MDDYIMEACLPIWKVLTWLGIGIFCVMVIRFIIDTCNDICNTETEEEKSRSRSRSNRRRSETSGKSRSTSEPNSYCNSPKIRNNV